MTSCSPIVPETMKALVVQGRGSAAVKQIPVPTIDDDEILVKVVCAAQNPTDWQYIDNIGNPGTIVGVDWSGLVVKIGSGVNTFAIGDHVAGFTHGGMYTDRGAYAEYLKTTADLAWKVPEGTLSHEEAATMGAGLWTPIQACFHPGRLGMVEPPEKVKGEEWIFVYGGSGSVGMFALQVARLAGYKVVTTASPGNWDLCRSFGADFVFDYRDPEVVGKIKQATNDSIHLAFDTISKVETQVLDVQVMAPGPGKIVLVKPVEEEAAGLRDDVSLQHTLLYTVLGRDFFQRKFWPASTEDRGHMARFLTKLPALVQSGDVKPNPVKLWEGGLEAVNDGLQYMREGKVSAVKIVYRISA